MSKNKFEVVGYEDAVRLYGEGDLSNPITPFTLIKVG